MKVLIVKESDIQKYGILDKILNSVPKISIELDNLSDESKVKLVRAAFAGGKDDNREK